MPVLTMYLQVHAPICPYFHRTSLRINAPTSSNNWRGTGR